MLTRNFIFCAVQLELAYTGFESFDCWFKSDGINPIKVDYKIIQNNFGNRLV